jgi:N-acetylglucosaminyl-diphospho-decaprenol L-rhamnosyltransferase
VALSIDVVVVTYEQWDLTASCLRHLQRQTVPHRLILVDNGSSDDSVDRARSTFPGVDVIELGRRHGFPAACNVGVAAGNGDVVAQINNDVDCRPDFLETLVAPMERDERVGLVSCRLLRPGGQTIDSVGLACDRTLATFQRFHGRPVADGASDRPVVAGPAGAAALVRRRAWEDVRGWDEAISFYSEDIDLALRVRIAGWRHAIATGAVATHVGSATAGHRSAWQRRHGGFGRGYILRRYGVLRTRAAPRALLAEAIVVAGDTVIGRDLAAIKGRVAGWRAAGARPRLPMPPHDAIDYDISFRDSLRLRRGVYFRQSSPSDCTLIDGGSGSGTPALGPMEATRER